MARELVAQKIDQVGVQHQLEVNFVLPDGSRVALPGVTTHTVTAESPGTGPGAEVVLGPYRVADVGIEFTDHNAVEGAQTWTYPDPAHFQREAISGSDARGGYTGYRYFLDDAGGASGSASGGDPVADDSPFHRYKLDDAVGSSTALDSTGTINGTATAVTFGQASLLAGGNGTAASFNGSTSEISVNTVDGSQVRTIECVVTTTDRATSERPGIATVFHNGDGFTRLGIHYDVATGKACAILNKQGTPLMGATVISDGQPHRIALTYDPAASGGTLKLLVDGVVEATRTSAGALQDCNWFRIGSGRAGFSYEYFKGVIDDVSYYSVPLSDAQLAAHDADPTPVESKDNDFNDVIFELREYVESISLYDPEYQPELYRYYVANMTTDEIIAELPLTDVTYSARVNSAGELTATLNSIDAVQGLDAYWATMPARTSIWVVRNGDVVWGGIIWNRTYNARDRSLQIQAATWESYLYKRHVWHTYSVKSENSDQYDIVRSILTAINHDFSLQNIDASENVTPWPDPAQVFLRAESRLAGRTLDDFTFYGHELKTVGEVIEEIANVENGFEYNFNYRWADNVPEGEPPRFTRFILFRDTPPHLLPVGTPKPTNTEADKPGIDTYFFEFPGNIMDITLEEDGEGAATRQFVVGGFPPGVSVPEGVPKPRNSWNNMEYDGSGFPLIENVEASRHATEMGDARLKRLSRIYGRRSSAPLRTWQVTVNGALDPIIGSYKLGDWCRLIINDDFVRSSLEFQADTWNKKVANGYIKRIMGWSVSVPVGPQEPETVTLELEDDWDVEVDS